MKNKTGLLLLLTVLCLISACVMNTQFTTEEPEIVLLIDTIQKYESAQGHPPSELEELIPEYIQEISIPNSVENVKYRLDQQNDSWVLTYHAKIGTICEYEGYSNSWGCAIHVNEN